MGPLTQLPARPIGVPEIVELLRAGEPSGLVTHGGRQYAVDRVESVGWYHVLEVEL